MVVMSKVKQIINIGNKEKLSTHVETIFKRYSQPGLHICDLATGGGKSYTIGKLTCEYYPKYFDKIIILCVKKDLVNAMNEDIGKHIDSKDSLISKDDKIVVKSNTDALLEAIPDAINSLIKEFREGIKKIKVERERKKLKSTLRDLINNLPSKEDNKARLQEEMAEKEGIIRSCIKSYLTSFKGYYFGGEGEIDMDAINDLFPSLEKVYPSSAFDRKKVIILTDRKAVYGIDTILHGTRELARNKQFKKTLFIFDESDQIALSIRSAIIERSINKYECDSIYNLYLDSLKILKNSNQISRYADGCHSAFNKAQKRIIERWKRYFGDTIPYIDVFSNDIEIIEDMIRGMFFSGPLMRLSIKPEKSTADSYICYKKKMDYFTLVCTDKPQEIEGVYDVVLTEKQFVSLLLGSINIIKNCMCDIVLNMYNKQLKAAKSSLKKIASNSFNEDTLSLRIPTIDQMVSTFVSRLGLVQNGFWESQLLNHIINRKNVVISKDVKIPDSSVYAQGFMYFKEHVRSKDFYNGIHISFKGISTTPEKMLVNLLLDETNSVVLCSATAGNKSVVSNFDLNYVRKNVQTRIDRLKKEDYSRFDELVAATYPENHKIECHSIYGFTYPKNPIERDIMEMPSEYKDLLPKPLVENGTIDEWYNNTVNSMMNKYKKDNPVQSTAYALNRLWKYIETYHFFYHQKDLKSFLFFQSRSGEKDRVEYTFLSCLIDGTYQKYVNSKGKIDLKKIAEWENETLLISKDITEIEQLAMAELSSSKENRKFLVTAYNSFKAGANLQYIAPKGIRLLKGESWNTNSKAKKDWDGIYLQIPTSYLSLAEDYNKEWEKSFYNVLLNLLMFYETGTMSMEQVLHWAYKAQINDFMFSENTCPSILMDKIAWMQTIIEQAVGRICRTKNKSCSTYILYDEEIAAYSRHFNSKKSLTPEFRKLLSAMNGNEDKAFEQKIKQSVRFNKLNRAFRKLKNMRTDALMYTPKLYGKCLYDETDADSEIPHFVKAGQFQNDYYKQMIIKKPVISNLEEISDDVKVLEFIEDCYVEYNSADVERLTSKSKLSTLVKNEIVKEHFISKGIPVEWAKEGLMLHHDILEADYTGEIGEEAFLALVLHYSSLKGYQIKHLEGKDYEVADFVILDSKGNYKIAIDVKNRKPHTYYLDNVEDMPFTTKKRIKKERLKCEVIFVNILETDGSSLDNIREIGGLLNSKGQVIMKNLQILLDLIDK